MNKKVLLISSLFGAALATGLSVQAGGARVDHIVDKGNRICVEDVEPIYGLDRVTCTLEEGVWTRVVTKSGNMNISFNGTLNVTVDWYEGGALVAAWSQTGSSHSKQLFKAGEPQVIKRRSSEVIELDNDYLDLCHIVTTETDYQFVNGEVIKDNPRYLYEDC
jgi:hypothetical protein